jgi:hypothetical protein
MGPIAELGVPLSLSSRGVVEAIKSLRQSCFGFGVLFLLPVPSTEYLEALPNPDLVFEVGHGNDHKVMHDL